VTLLDTKKRITNQNGSYNYWLKSVWATSPGHKHQEESSDVKDEADVHAGEVPVSCPVNTTWQEFFKVSSNQYCGFVESVDTAKEMIRRYEQETTTKCSCYKSDPSLGYGGEA